MSEILENKPPVWFWIVSGIALIWNLLGVGAYLMQVMDPEAAMETMTAAEKAATLALPGWYTVVFAIAVFAGAIGCLGLLLRKKWAFMLLVLSLVAVVVQQLYLRFSTEIDTLTWMYLMIPIISVFLVWFAKHMTKKGILK
ncbi:MAG: hypothetical protein EX271_13230 [Acidimicrobiales bacterium]|nr:hypothetical protein [Hyphomonadaceae bacterium]RZV34946.1 MAG: hypothetical protein EX271_13230 [Acidimicrobiales bacterium]